MKTARQVSTLPNPNCTPHMANPYFAFKQFTIWQAGAGMKVCTDACVFGAAVPLKGGESVLDIGTGTGLLALMLAQRGANHICGVELDVAAYQQAQENMRRSPWPNTVTLWHGPIQQYNTGPKGGFDVVICNPTFFAKHLQPANGARQRALHNDTLPLADLQQAARRWLSAQGRFYVMLPPNEASQLQGLMQQAGLQPFWQMHLHHNAQSKLLRVMTGYSYRNSPCTPCRLDIYGSNGEYSTPFIALLQPFYLYL